MQTMIEYHDPCLQLKAHACMVFSDQHCTTPPFPDELLTHAAFDIERYEVHRTHTTDDDRRDVRALTAKNQPTN